MRMQQEVEFNAALVERASHPVPLIVPVTRLLNNMPSALIRHRRVVDDGCRRTVAAIEQAVRLHPFTLASPNMTTLCIGARTFRACPQK
jgi:hypothetical protein